MYPRHETISKTIRRPSHNPFATIHEDFGETVVLRLDFVAQPNGTEELDGSLATLLQHAQLRREGLQSAVLLVSDREARVMTLLTFWDCASFHNARERRIAWMQKLLTPFADGPIRAQICRPRFLLKEMPSSPQPEVFAELSQLSPELSSELNHVAALLTGRAR